MSAAVANRTQQEASRSTGEEHKKGGLQKAGEGKREVNPKVGREGAD
jgi:hypothetical protein